MTDEEYRTTIDAEAVAHARKKPRPSPDTVRRVRIDDVPHELARQRMEESDD
jgi:hypothetical protein